MPEKEQINIRVASGTKQDWENHVDETNEFASLTGLIRKSVEKEIRSNEPTEGAGMAPSVSSDIESIDNQLEDVVEDVRWIRHELEDDEALSDLAQEVYAELEELPTYRGKVDVPEDVDESEFRKRQAAHQLIRPSNEEEAEEGGNPQTVAVLADKVGATERDVAEAIEYLEEQYLPIVEVQLDSGTHYFKEE